MKWKGEGLGVAPSRPADPGLGLAAILVHFSYSRLAGLGTRKKRQEAANKSQRHGTRVGGGPGGKGRQGEAGKPWETAGCNPRPSQLTRLPCPNISFCNACTAAMLAAAAVQCLQGRSTGRIAVLKQLTAPSIDMEAAERCASSSTERGIQQRLGWAGPAIPEPITHHPSAIPSAIPSPSPSGPPCACVMRVRRCIRLRRPADGDADKSFRLLLPFPARQPTPLVSAQRPSHPEATQRPSNAGSRPPMRCHGRHSPSPIPILSRRRQLVSY